MPRLQDKTPYTEKPVAPGATVGGSSWTKDWLKFDNRCRGGGWEGGKGIVVCVRVYASCFHHSGAVQQAGEAVDTAPLIQIPVLLKIALVLSCLLFF